MNRDLENIIAWNAIAVTQYQHGNNHKAILSWASILRSVTGKPDSGRSYVQSSSSTTQPAAGLLCRQDVIARQDAQLHMHATAESHVLGAPSCTNKSSLVILHAIYPTKETMTHTYYEKYSEIFNGAFHIPKDDGILMSLEENDVVIVLLYNLALMLHRKGIQDGNNSSLLRASRLYEEALMLTHEQQQNEGLNDASCGYRRIYYAIITAAACCNLSHVSSMFLLKPSKDLIHQFIGAVKVMESHESIISNQFDIKFFHIVIHCLNQGIFITAPSA